MSLSIFSALYETVCGINEDSPEYRESIFRNVGLSTLLVCIGLGLVFYIVLGRWKNVWDTRTHWAITLTLGILAGFLLAVTMAKSVLGQLNAYLLQFAIINGGIAAVYFILLSLLLKKFSIYARRTPF